MYRLLLPVLGVILLLNACSKDRFRAEVPSYLSIQSIHLETESYQGSDSEKITDAWVTMDGIFLGAFQVPCTVPILDEGAHEFSIYAGIKANGISATRIRYPFYEVCDLYSSFGDTLIRIESNNVELIKDSVVTIVAKTNYTENTEFLFVENFEDAGTIIEASNDSDTILNKINTDSLVFEGYGSGAVFLDTVNDFFELMSSEFRTLNSIYNPTMLEMDYRCDHSFKIGVAVKSAETGEIDLYESLHIDSSKVWNKIYVHMTNQVNLGNSNDEFGIFIGIRKNDSYEKASFYFDNIKWLHEQ